MALLRTVLYLGLGSLVLLPASASAPPAAITTIACPGAAITVVKTNDAGRGVGFYCHSVAQCFPFGAHGFIWDGSGCEPIPGLPDGWMPVGMNDAEQVIGIHVVGSKVRGFLYRRGQVMDLLCPNTGTNKCVAFPRGINNRGQIVGYYEVEGPDSPFMWEDGSYVALGELPREWEPATVRANGINPRGDVAGEWHGWGGDITQGYLWPKDGAPVSFGFPLGVDAPTVAKTTMPSAITPRGDMVGYFYESMSEEEASVAGGLFGPCRGFFRDRDGAMTELKVPGATYTCPLGINAAGEISGVYTTDSETTSLAEISWHGFVAKVKALVVR